MQKDDGTDTTVLKNLKLLLVAAGQGSQARIIALATRAGSRSEQLFGQGSWCRAAGCRRRHWLTA
jgi:hypothetical protein